MLRWVRLDVNGMTFELAACILRDRSIQGSSKRMSRP
jgi:hypothetical protein